MASDVWVSQWTIVFIVSEVMFNVVRCFGGRSGRNEVLVLRFVSEFDEIASTSSEQHPCLIVHGTSLI